MTASLPKLTAVALVGALGLAAVVAFSQIGESRPEPQLKKDHIVARPPGAEAAQPRSGENVVALSKPGDKDAIAVASLFRSQATPSTRATYFRSVLNNPALRFQGWHLTILEANAVDGVTRVKLRAMPLVTSESAATVVSGMLDETYEVKGGHLNLVKTDPPVDPAVVVEFPIQGF
jgi:hypothetical protein